MATIPGVADGELIRTTWGDAVADELNANTVKRDGTVAMTGNLTIQKTAAGVFLNDAGGASVAQFYDTGPPTGLVIGVPVGRLIRHFVNGGDRLTIDGAGTVLFNKLTAGTTAVGVEVQTYGEIDSTVAVGVANLGLNRIAAAATNGEAFVSFANTATLIGSIVMNGTTGVLYQTTSDYRLKNDLGPVPDALERINVLRPRRVSWVGDPDRGESEALIAHEVEPVAGYAVNGAKDAVAGPPEYPSSPPQGTPIYQQLDYSALAPLTIAAIQELAGKVDDLTARLDALEAAA